MTQTTVVRHLSDEHIDKLKQSICGDFSKGFYRHDPYLCFTDGRFLVALECDNEGPSPPPSFTSTSELFRSDLPCVLSLDTTAEKLADWCKLEECTICKNKRQVKCEECDGSGGVWCECKCGERGHDIDCEDCGGTGFTDCSCLEANPGLISTFPFNRQLIRRGLEESKARGPITLRIIKDGHGANRIDIRMEHAILLVMGIRKDGKNYSRFET